MRIDSDGDVGIGVNNPEAKLHIFGNNITNVVNSESAIFLKRSGSSATGIGVSIDFVVANTPGTIPSAKIASHRTGAINAPADLRFSTGDATNGVTERMRIDSSGNVLVGKTTGSLNVAGSGLFSNGQVDAVASATTVLSVNRLTDDGTLVSFFQAGVEEGTISVSGATVSYNGFTGSHWSRFIGDSKPDVLRGTVMESLDQMNDWYHVEFEVSTTEKDSDGNDVVKNTTQKKPYALKANEQEGDVITYAWNTEKKDEDDNDIIEQVQATIVKEKDVKHVMSKISDTVEAKNVYGVFSHWDNDDLINNDFYVASVGSYVVRIKAGEVVSKGDLLQSNGDGTAKVQADDLVRASSFAKVLSNTVIDTYEDGSFIVPCSLMC
jgi:hypothetical protein